jgi:NADH-quinone oxidoreductase subunit M
MTGPTVPAVAGMKDLGLREVSALAPLLVLIVLLGFYPKPLTTIIDPAVQDTLQHVGVSDPAPEVPAHAGSGEEEESHQ